MVLSYCKSFSHVIRNVSISFSVLHKVILTTTDIIVTYYDVVDYMRIAACMIPCPTRHWSVTTNSTLSVSPTSSRPRCWIRNDDHFHIVIQLSPDNVSLLAYFSPRCKHRLFYTLRYVDENSPYVILVPRYQDAYGYIHIMVCVVPYVPRPQTRTSPSNGVKPFALDEINMTRSLSRCRIRSPFLNLERPIIPSNVLSTIIYSSTATVNGRIPRRQFVNLQSNPPGTTDEEYNLINRNLLL